MQRKRNNFRDTARGARSFALFFGCFFALMAVGLVLDRSQVLRGQLGVSFMKKWFAIDPTNENLDQIVFMSAGGFGIYGFMFLMHRAFRKMH